MTYMVLAVSLTSNIFQPLCNALLYGYFLQWCRSSLRQKKRSILVLDGISSSNPFSPAFGVRSRKASNSCWKGDTIHSFKNLGVWENETRKSLQSIGVRRNHEASQWHCHNMRCTGDEDVARRIAGTCWIIKEHILIRLTKKTWNKLESKHFPVGQIITVNLIPFGCEAEETKNAVAIAKWNPETPVSPHQLLLYSKKKSIFNLPTFQLSKQIQQNISKTAKAVPGYLIPAYLR